MSRTLLAAVVSIAAVSGVACAAPAKLDLAKMNLSPTRDVTRQIPTRSFVTDKVPTAFDYSLPAPGMDAELGYRTSTDAHSVQGYEVNQATALGFSQPSASVGASVGYKF